MRTRTVSSTLARLVVAGACVVSTVSCGGDLLRTGRAPVYLVVTNVSGGAEGAQLAQTLFSDVRQTGNVGVVNDNVQVTLRAELKNPTIAATAVNAVTMTRYRVNFRRADGRNTPGVDVPYGFDGVLSQTLSPGEERSVIFVIVRHSMKLEPPLSNLAALSPAGERLISGQGFITAVAEITLWGRDQNGNEVSANAAIDVHFGNFTNS